MYLARKRIHNQTHYFIRQSYKSEKYFKSRDLYDLGTDPTQYIIYPGGNSYYYDLNIIDTLAVKGVHVDQTDLDIIFFDFLHPEIQRVITGFDRSYLTKARHRRNGETPAAGTVHQFDKRRYFFLRFGPRLRQNIKGQPEKLFRPLANKSRDELEQYFLQEEHILKRHEIPVYMTTIFGLKQFRPNPESKLSPSNQLDQHFLSKLCDLDNDHRFWAGNPEAASLHNDLVKYVIMYFDFHAYPSTGWQYHIHDFINRHRTYRPPPKVQIKMAEAEKLFGLPWRELKRLDRTALSRKYRRLALKHHPDQGGNPKLFDRLTQYYKALLAKAK